MKKIMLAVLPSLALSVAAPLAHADEGLAADAALGQMAPLSQGVPMALGSGLEQGPAGVLGNWNANAGHVALQETAQVLGAGQQDVYNIASGGNASHHS
ncbi:hypothetical protein [Streptomyces sp. NPDC003952]